MSSLPTDVEVNNIVDKLNRSRDNEDRKEKLEVAVMAVSRLESGVAEAVNQEEFSKVEELSNLSFKLSNAIERAEKANSANTGEGGGNDAIEAGFGGKLGNSQGGSGGEGGGGNSNFGGMSGGFVPENAEDVGGGGVFAAAMQASIGSDSKKGKSNSSTEKSNRNADPFGDDSIFDRIETPNSNAGGNNRDSNNKSSRSNRGNNNSSSGQNDNNAFGDDAFGFGNDAFGNFPQPKSARSRRKSSLKKRKKEKQPVEQPEQRRSVSFQLTPSSEGIGSAGVPAGADARQAEFGRGESELDGGQFGGPSSKSDFNSAGKDSEAGSGVGGGQSSSGRGQSSSGSGGETASVGDGHASDQSNASALAASVASNSNRSNANPSNQRSSNLDQSSADNNSVRSADNNSVQTVLSGSGGESGLNIPSSPGAARASEDEFMRAIEASLQEEKKQKDSANLEDEALALALKLSKGESGDKDESGGDKTGSGNESVASKTSTTNETSGDKGASGDKESKSASAPGGEDSKSAGENAATASGSSSSSSSTTAAGTQAASSENNEFKPPQHPPRTTAEAIAMALQWTQPMLAQSLPYNRASKQKAGEAVGSTAAPSSSSSSTGGPQSSGDESGAGTQDGGPGGPTTGPKTAEEAIQLALAMSLAEEGAALSTKGTGTSEAASATVRLQNMWRAATLLSQSQGQSTANTAGAGAGNTSTADGNAGGAAADATAAPGRATGAAPSGVPKTTEEAIALAMTLSAADNAAANQAGAGGAAAPASGSAAADSSAATSATSAQPGATAGSVDVNAIPKTTEEAIAIAMALSLQKSEGAAAAAGGGSGMSGGAPSVSTAASPTSADPRRVDSDISAAPGTYPPGTIQPLAQSLPAQVSQQAFAGCVAGPGQFPMPPPQPAALQPFAGCVAGPGNVPISAQQAGSAQSLSEAQQQHDADTAAQIEAINAAKTAAEAQLAEKNRLLQQQQLGNATLFRQLQLALAEIKSAGQERQKLEGQLAVVANRLTTMTQQKLEVQRECYQANQDKARVENMYENREEIISDTRTRLFAEKERTATMTEELRKKGEIYDTLQRRLKEAREDNMASDTQLRDLHHILDTTTAELVGNRVQFVACKDRQPAACWDTVTRMVDEGDELAYTGNQLALEGGAAASAFGNAAGNANGNRNNANNNTNITTHVCHVSPPLKVETIAPVILQNNTSFPFLLSADAGAKIVLDTERNFRNILIGRRGKLFEDPNMVVRIEMMSVRQSGLSPKESAYSGINSGDEEDGKATALVVAAEEEARADGSQTQPGMIVTVENKSNQRMLNVELSLASVPIWPLTEGATFTEILPEVNPGDQGSVYLSLANGSGIFAPGTQNGNGTSSSYKPFASTEEKAKQQAFESGAKPPFPPIFEGTPTLKVEYLGSDSTTQRMQLRVPMYWTASVGRPIRMKATNFYQRWNSREFLENEARFRGSGRAAFFAEGRASFLYFLKCCELGGAFACLTSGIAGEAGEVIDQYSSTPGGSSVLFTAVAPRATAFPEVLVKAELRQELVTEGTRVQRQNDKSPFYRRGLSNANNSDNSLSPTKTSPTKGARAEQRNVRKINTIAVTVRSTSVAISRAVRSMLIDILCVGTIEEEPQSFGVLAVRNKEIVVNAFSPSARGERNDPNRFESSFNDQPESSARENNGNNQQQLAIMPATPGQSSNDFGGTDYFAERNGGASSAASTANTHTSANPASRLLVFTDESAVRNVDQQILQQRRDDESRRVAAQVRGVASSAFVGRQMTFGNQPATQQQISQAEAAVAEAKQRVQLPEFMQSTNQNSASSSSGQAIVLAGQESASPFQDFANNASNVNYNRSPAAPLLGIVPHFSGADVAMTTSNNIILKGAASNSNNPYASNSNNPYATSSTSNNPYAANNTTPSNVERIATRGSTNTTRVGGSPADMSFHANFHGNFHGATNIHNDRPLGEGLVNLAGPGVNGQLPAPGSPMSKAMIRLAGTMAKRHADGDGAAASADPVNALPRSNSNYVNALPQSGLSGFSSAYTAGSGSSLRELVRGPQDGPERGAKDGAQETSAPLAPLRALSGAQQQISEETRMKIQLKMKEMEERRRQQAAEDAEDLAAGNDGGNSGNTGNGNTKGDGNHSNNRSNPLDSTLFRKNDNGNESAGGNAAGSTASLAEIMARKR